MDTRQTVADRIIQLCEEQKMPIQTLARKAGVPPSTLKNIVNGVSQNPGIVTIKLICDGLEISLSDFFHTEEFSRLEQEMK